MPAKKRGAIGDPPETDVEQEQEQDQQEEPMQGANAVKEHSNNGASADRQLIPTVEGTALATYQDREVVKELVSRLMSFHPAKDEVGQAGMLMAAQLALLMGASPLPGTNEIHIWKDNRGNINVSPGINYWRRRAQTYGGIWWVDRPRPMTELERREYYIPDGELAAICIGMSMQEIQPLLDRNVSIKDIAKAKAIIGVGTVTTSKTQYGAYKEQKSGRPLIWTAVKRAETDILKQLFPYRPGESFTAGAGLRPMEGGGGYTLDTASPHWAGLSMTLAEPERTLPEGDRSVDDINEELFGSKAGYGTVQVDFEPEDDETEFVEVMSDQGKHMVPVDIVALGDDAIREYVHDLEANGD